MLDWIVIGGGVQGTYLSHALTTLRGHAPDRVCVIDPHAEPLAIWRRHTSAVGMDYLRSPQVHHIDIDPMSLRRFAEASNNENFTGRYHRPSLDLFMRHADRVIEKANLRAMRVGGTAREIAREDSSFRVDTEYGSLHARRVAIAIGIGDQSVYPRWAKELRASGGNVSHVFDGGGAEGDGGTTVIVGGGLSAAQKALAIAANGVEKAVIIARHDPRHWEFDNDPCWNGPKCIDTIDHVGDWGRRRMMVDSARYRGSIPRDVMNALERYKDDGRIEWRVDSVDSGSRTNGTMDLRLGSGDSVTASRVVLCTGFDSKRPGGAFIDQTIQQLGLPCADCGYPKVRPTLEWADDLFVIGPLAELGIGPAARVINGARQAAKRILAAAK